MQRSYHVYIHNSTRGYLYAGVLCCYVYRSGFGNDNPCMQLSAGFPHETGVGQGHVLHEAPLIIIYTKCSFDDDILCKDDCTRSFYTSIGHFYHQHAGKEWPPYALPYVPAYATITLVHRLYFRTMAALFFLTEVTSF